MGEAAAQRCEWTSSRVNGKGSNLVTGSLALWEPGSWEGGGGRGGRAGCGVGFVMSLSLVAARGVSGQRFQALTQWLPGFQSLAPADIMRERKTHCVQTVICMLELLVFMHNSSKNNRTSLASAPGFPAC